MRTIFLAMVLMMSATGASAQVEDNAVWIDVRTPEEFAAGHVEGATRIPWDGIEKGVAQLELAKDTPVYLYCGTGGRAGKAKERLDAMGFTAVTNAGGLEDARKLAQPQ